ncbi:hypothetical protein AMJ57_05130 [Parcubacteria bacterium SG8_24]|nr:MAG: hypothetical protein AMJ57_05130 [Parcubacteria bacterium SG8_24]
MTSRLKFWLATSGWMAIHCLYFWFYYRLLGLTFAPLSLFFTLLFSLWILVLLVCFRSRLMCGLITAIYTVALSWALFNFGYHQVFRKFLQLPLTRAGSLNLPMLLWLKDFAHLIPWPMAVFSAGLIAALFLYRQTIQTLFAVPKRYILMREGDERYYVESPGHRISRWPAVAVMICAHLLGYLLVTGAIGWYHERIERSLADPAGATADLGIFGYALAATPRQPAAAAGPTTETALPATDRISVEEEPIPSAAPGPIRTELETLHGYLDALAALAPRAPAPPDRPTVSDRPHVIVYQMESVSYWPLDQEPSPMPFLESLMAGQYTVDRYFANGCTTIDAEFVVNCGYLPETFGPVSDLFTENSYHCLPTILKSLGYETYLYHANDIRFWSRDKLAPAWGFDHLLFSPEIPHREPDQNVFDTIVDQLAVAPSPGYHYVIGMTSHSPHNEHFRRFYERQHQLDIRPYNGTLDEETRPRLLDEATLRLYLGFLQATDDGLRHLFVRLEAAGLLERTIVVVLADHRYYDFTADRQLDRFLNYNRLPFVLYVPGGRSAGPLRPVASHVDVAPTLLGLIDGSLVPPGSFLGKSLFDPDHRPFVVNKCLGSVNLYDGRLLIEGDEAFGIYRVTASEGGTAAADGRAMLDPLKRLVARSDRLLRENRLGEDQVIGPAVPAPKEVRTDQVTDSDRDGLSDLRETALKTNKRDPDTDGDGFMDGVEVTHGYDPLGPGRLEAPPVE